MILHVGLISKSQTKLTVWHINDNFYLHTREEEECEEEVTPRFFSDQCLLFTISIID